MPTRWEKAIFHGSWPIRPTRLPRTSSSCSAAIPPNTMFPSSPAPASCARWIRISTVPGPSSSRATAAGAGPRRRSPPLCNPSSKVVATICPRATSPTAGTSPTSLVWAKSRSRAPSSRSTATGAKTGACSRFSNSSGFPTRVRACSAPRARWTRPAPRRSSPLASFLSRPRSSSPRPSAPRPSRNASTSGAISRWS